MFDRIYPTEVRETVRIPDPKIVKIKEEVGAHRAVELMREFEEEAIQKIDGRFKLHNNIFNVDIYWHIDTATQDYIFRCLFKVNGKDYKCCFNIEYCDVRYDDEMTKLIDALYENISHEITYLILKPININHFVEYVEGSFKGDI